MWLELGTVVVRKFLASRWFQVAGMVSAVIVVILALAGCQSAGGLFNVGQDECSIVAGEVEIEGRVTNTDAEGIGYIRRGSCDEHDRAAYERALGGQG